MTFYRLSSAADQDIGEIFDYTQEHFGKAQAIYYVELLDEACTQIADNPRLGRERTEIQEGLRSLPVQGHIIFYRLFEDYIRIVRILHARRDILYLMDKEADW